MLKLNGTLRRPIFLWLSSFVADALEGRRPVAEADAAIRSVRTSAIAAGGRAPVVGQQWGGLPTVEAMTSLTKNELMPQR